MTASSPPSEARWPSGLAVLGAVGLYATLPGALVFGPSYVRYVIPALELTVLVPLFVLAPHLEAGESGTRRKVAMSLTALISIANALSLLYLIHELLYNTSIGGRPLLYGALDVWATNVIVFALWYWELDGGGPPKRLERRKNTRDFAFVQMTDPEVAERGWQPRFADYLYVSFTNASAFSPTDTMPLTHWAKLLMMLQSLVSILTLLLVAARAVNILH